MSTSSIQNSLIPAACIAGAVFGISITPLALYRSDVVAVELQNRPLFAAEVRDLAGPYLGLTGIMSVSIGASIMGFSGWRRAARKSEAAESKVSGLQQDLLTHQAELEAIKFSESRLRAHHLDAFLEPHSPIEAVNQQVQRLPLAAVPGPQTAPLAAASQPPIAPVKPLKAAAYVSYPQSTSHQLPPAETAEGVKDKAMMALSAAQTYVSYARSKSPARPITDPAKNPDLQSVQLEHLLVQLKELAHQVEELRTGASDGLAA
jgi:hypothetical protein